MGFDLADCKALDSLQLSVWVLSRPNNPQWSWTLTLDILSRTPPSLRRFTLWIDTATYLPKSELPMNCWAELDEALQGFPDLQAVELSYSRYQYFDEFEQVVEGLMPSTSNLIVRFAVSDSIEAAFRKRNTSLLLVNRTLSITRLLYTVIPVHASCTFLNTIVLDGLIHG